MYISKPHPDKAVLYLPSPYQGEGLGVRFYVPYLTENRYKSKVENLHQAISFMTERGCDRIASSDNRIISRHNRIVSSDNRIASSIAKFTPRTFALTSALLCV
jgi:hypothetical protein